MKAAKRKVHAAFDEMPRSLSEMPASFDDGNVHLAMATHHYFTPAPEMKPRSA